MSLDCFSSPILCHEILHRFYSKPIDSVPSSSGTIDSEVRLVTDLPRQKCPVRRRRATTTVSFNSAAPLWHELPMRPRSLSSVGAPLFECVLGPSLARVRPRPARSLPVRRPLHCARSQMAGMAATSDAIGPARSPSHRAGSPLQLELLMVAQQGLELDA